MPALVYELQQPGDCEGRSRTTVGHFALRDAAVAVGETMVGNASMSPQPGDARIVELTVYASVEEFIRHSKPYGVEAAGRLSPGYRDQLRQKALAKLTREDRRVLGLD